MVDEDLLPIKILQPPKDAAIQYATTTTSNLLTDGVSRACLQSASATPPHSLVDFSQEPQKSRWRKRQYHHAQHLRKLEERRSNTSSLTLRTMWSLQLMYFVKSLRLFVKATKRSDKDWWRAKLVRSGVDFGTWPRWWELVGDVDVTWDEGSFVHQLSVLLDYACEAKSRPRTIPCSRAAICIYPLAWVTYQTKSGCDGLPHRQLCSLADQQFSALAIVLLLDVRCTFLIKAITLPSEHPLVCRTLRGTELVRYHLLCKLGDCFDRVSLVRLLRHRVYGSVLTGLLPHNLLRHLVSGVFARLLRLQCLRDLVHGSILASLRL